MLELTKTDLHPPLRFEWLGVELIPFSVTFLCCLFINVEYGILIGAGFHLILLAYMGNRPHPVITRLPVMFQN